MKFNYVTQACERTGFLENYIIKFRDYSQKSIDNRMLKFYNGILGYQIGSSLDDNVM